MLAYNMVDGKHFLENDTVITVVFEGVVTLQQ